MLAQQSVVEGVMSVSGGLSPVGAHQDPGTSPGKPGPGRDLGTWAVSIQQMPRAESTAGSASLLAILLCRFYGDVSSFENSVFYVLKEIWLQPQQALARYSLKGLLIRKLHLKCVLCSA